tara:strand:- start:80 stop:1993 length:1914 start_codon:yes stop_codon:yes gene_type:complete
MPAFTYVASLIVAEVIGIAGAAILGSAGLAFVTSVVALGLGLATSRLLGLSGGSGGTDQNPGVRIQFPPATTNKVPVVYGSANTRGIITDARLSNENKLMTYVLTISEKTQTGVFSVGDIFWNDQLLQFDPSAGNEHKVISSIDQNGNGVENTTYNGFISMRLYSGGTGADKQIFPPQASGNTESALVALDESDANYLMTDLVFAVIQVVFDSGNRGGPNGLGQVTFQITNSLKNPGLVWYDYMTAERYGFGTTSTNIDTVSCISTTTSTSIYSVSNEIPPNQYLAGGVTATNQVRYEINGVISTGDTVKNNLDKISIACEAFTSFDYSQGQWKMIANRAATSGELATAFHFTDDNIIGDVGITATNLEDLYNNLEVEFASRRIKDQNDYYRAEIDPGVRNALEPENKLSLRLDLANNALHAARIGLIELKQSRADLIINFRADYSALQVEAGDVVKITNEVYGFDEKLFRISKTRELEDDVGGITIEITALQYDAAVYTDETLQDSADTPGSGIPTFGGSARLPAPSQPTVTTINTTTPGFNISTTINATSDVVDEVRWWINTTSTNSPTTFQYFASQPSGASGFPPGTVVTDTVTWPETGTFYFQAQAGKAGRYSDYSTSTSVGFVWNPNNFGGI